MFVQVGKNHFVAVAKIEAVRGFKTNPDICRIGMESGEEIEADVDLATFMARIETAAINFAVRIGFASTRAAREEFGA